MRTSTSPRATIGWPSSAASHLAGLTIAHPMLAPVPVPHLGFDARTKGTVDAKERTLHAHRGGGRLPQPARDRSPPTWRTSGASRASPRRCRCGRCRVRSRCRRFPSSWCPYLQGFKLDGDLLDRSAPRRSISRIWRRRSTSAATSASRAARWSQAPEWVVAERLLGDLRADGGDRAGQVDDLRRRAGEPRLGAVRRDLAAPHQLDHDHRGLRLLQAPRLHPVGVPLGAAAEPAARLLPAGRVVDHHADGEERAARRARRRSRASCRRCSSPGTSSTSSPRSGSSRSTST